MLHLYESLFRAGYGEHPENFQKRENKKRNDSDENRSA